LFEQSNLSRLCRVQEKFVRRNLARGTAHEFGRGYQPAVFDGKAIELDDPVAEILLAVPHFLCAKM